MNENNERIRLFRKVMQTLGEMEIKAWLDQGTLLGVVREGRFLPWDNDVDIGLWDSDIKSREKEFFEKLSESARVTVRKRMIFVNPHSRQGPLPVSIARYIRRGNKAVKYMQKFSENRLLHAIGAPAGRSLMRDRGFSLASRKNKKKNILTKLYSLSGRAILKTRAKLLDWFSKDIRCEVPSFFFDSLKREQVYGTVVFMPKEPEKYLALKYGEDWKTPKKDWQWWKEDGALSK